MDLIEEDLSTWSSAGRLDRMADLALVVRLEIMGRAQGTAVRDG